MIVGCSTTSGKYLLPNLVAAFRHSYPLVRVGIKVMSRDEVINRLIDGRLSLGVTSQKIDQRDLEKKPFFEDRVIFDRTSAAPLGRVWLALPSRSGR
ncbi:MAG: LysR substrate-binding domain-containing protein [Anaerolineae bacterium]